MKYLSKSILLLKNKQIEHQLRIQLFEHLNVNSVLEQIIETTPILNT